MRLITSIGVSVCYRELASLCYPRGEVLHGDAKPLFSDVVLFRPLFSVGLPGAAVRPFGRNATVASETLGWLLFRSRSAGVLLRKLIVYLEGLWRAGIARYWNSDPIHVRC